MASPNWPVIASPGAECEATLVDPESIAASIYSAADQPAVTRTMVANLLPCVGVPLIPDDADEATLRAYLAGPFPGVLDATVGEIADGLANGATINLDSYVSGLAAQGVLDKATGTPLTRSALDAHLADLARGTGPESVVPRLLIALGRQRASAIDLDAPDPVWGEPSFDSLQLALFAFGLLAAYREATAVGQPLIASTNAVGPSSGGDTSGVNSIGAVVAVVRTISPTSSLGAASGVVCTEEILSHTYLKVNATPSVVWHSNGHDPDSATVLADLRFSGSNLPPSVSTFLTSVAGCVPPSGDHWTGKTVNWELDAKAQKHGRTSPTFGVTDQNGQVLTVYRTIPETTPRSQQIPPNLKSENVKVTANVANLIPGLPDALVSFHPGAVSRAVFIKVNWYQRSYKLVIDWHFKRVPGAVGDGFSSNIAVQGEIPLDKVVPPKLTVDGRSATYEGTGIITYVTAPVDGFCRVTYRGQGTIPVHVLATISDPLDPAQLVIELPIEMNKVGRDSIITTPCVGQNRPVSLPGNSLLTLFMTALEFRQPSEFTPFTVFVRDWQASTVGGVVATAIQRGHCGALCNFNGDYTLELR